MEKKTVNDAVFAINNCEIVPGNNRSTAACQARVNNSYWHKELSFIYTSCLILMGEKTMINHSTEETTQTAGKYDKNKDKTKIKTAVDLFTKRSSDLHVFLKVAVLTFIENEEKSRRSWTGFLNFLGFF